MTGLIIKQEWLDKIINNNKTWEIRNNATENINKEIYLLESNTQKIKAIAKINKCIPLNIKLWEEGKNNHQVDISFDTLLKIYKNPYAWVLQIIKVIDFDTYYNTKKGCIIWMNNLPEYKTILNDLIDDYDF
jgi:phosphopentomutase